MAALIFLFVKLIASLFKSKSRLEAENVALRRQKNGQAKPVVPENSIRPDSRDEGESEHHPTRCLPSSICLEHLWPTCSSRGAGLKSRTYFFGISSMLP